MPDPVGRMLGDYRIIDKVGEGGMGTVYRARDERLNRDVAIKVLPDRFAAEPGRLERFEREARAAAALTHPNILAVHQLGTTSEGAPFIVTELLEGSSLREVLDAGGIPPTEALEVGIQVAKGLAAAHGKGLIHRDLKPENVFVSDDGTVKILDFGLAKFLPPSPPRGQAAEAATETMHTAVGAVMGTSGYMSPEQVRGQAVDSRSDMFAFGILLYEMITGTNPFRRSTAADSVSALLNHDPPDPSSTGDRVPGFLDAIVRRCLQKRPQDRFQSARELLAALAEAATGGQEAAGTRRSPSVKVVTGTVVGVVLAIATAMLIPRLGGQAGTAPKSAPEPLRIVVMPFENLGDEEDDYFAVGMSDELISRLAAVNQLRVVSPGGRRQPPEDYVDLGHELDVDYVLKGSVRFSRRDDGSEHVRITPQLIRLSDGLLLWSEGLDRKLVDIIDVQSSIASRVLAALDLNLLGPERVAIDARPTTNVEAYQAYLRGLYYSEAAIEEDLVLAVSMFEKAVDLDPQFALAHAELSVAHSNLIETRIDPSETRAASAAAAADRALELDPDLARGRLGRAVYLATTGHDPAEALAELEAARRSSPNDGRVLFWQARLLGRQGRLEEAIEGFQQTIEVDPTNYQALLGLGATLGWLRRNGEADVTLKEAIALQPDRLPAYLARIWNALAWEGGTNLANEVLESVPVHHHRDVIEVRLFTLFADRDFDGALELLDAMPTRDVKSSSWLWSAELVECHAHHWMGRTNQARVSCESALADARTALERMPTDPRLWVAVANSEALLGNPQEAILAAERAIAVAAPTTLDRIQFKQDYAFTLAMVGEAERAVEALRAVLAQPGWMTHAWLAVDWRIDPIRDDPRFQALIAER